MSARPSPPPPARTRRAHPPAPAVDPATRRVMECVRHVVRELRVSAREAEAHAGVSSAQLFVLQKLALADVLSVGELAAYTLTDPSSVSTVVARLVAGGYVHRARAAGDARRLELAITPRGRAALARAPGVAQDRLIAAIGGLPGASRAQLARLLERVLAAMGVAPSPAALFFEDEPGAPKRRPARRKAVAR